MRKAEKVRLQANPEFQLAPGALRLALFETREGANPLFVQCVQPPRSAPACPPAQKEN